MLLNLKYVSIAEGVALLQSRNAPPRGRSSSKIHLALRETCGDNPNSSFYRTCVVPVRYMALLSSTTSSPLFTSTYNQALRDYNIRLRALSMAPHYLVDLSLIGICGWGRCYCSRGNLPGVVLAYTRMTQKHTMLAGFLPT